MKFKGFTAVYVESREEDDAAADEDAESAIPPLEEGEVLTLLGLDPKQHFTQPPPRFTEASLIKALEELGIGRPSTYASILSTIINDRGYVHRERRTLFPTELGMAVTDKLMPFFRRHHGRRASPPRWRTTSTRSRRASCGWVETVKEFYEPFKRDLARAKKEMGSEKVGVPIGEACPECGGDLIERRGRFGKFIACSNYPDCKYKRNLPGSERAEDQPTDEICPTCGEPDGDQARPLRQVHRVLGLPRVQDHQARDPRASRVRSARRARSSSAARARAGRSSAARPIPTASSCCGSVRWRSRARSARRRS